MMRRLFAWWRRRNAAAYADLMDWLEPPGPHPDVTVSTGPGTYTIEYGGQRLGTVTQVGIEADDGPLRQAFADTEAALARLQHPSFGFVTGDGTLDDLAESDEYRCGRCGGQRDRVQVGWAEGDDVPGLCPRCHPRLRTSASGGTL